MRLVRTMEAHLRAIMRSLMTTKPKDHIDWTERISLQRKRAKVFQTYAFHC